MHFKDIDMVESTIVRPDAIRNSPQKQPTQSDQTQYIKNNFDLPKEHSEFPDKKEAPVQKPPIDQSVDPFEEYEKAFPQNNVVFNNVPIVESGFIKRPEPIQKPKAPEPKELHQQHVAKKKYSCDVEYIVIGDDHASDHGTPVHKEEGKQNQLENMNTKIEKILLMMESNDRRLTQMEVTTKNLVQEMNDTREKVKNHQNAMQVAIQRVSQLESSHKNAMDSNPQLKQVDDRVQIMGQNIADLSKKVSANVLSIGNFEKTIGTITQRIDKVEQTEHVNQNKNVGSLMETSHVRGMTKKVLDNDDRLDIIAGLLEDVKNDVDQLDISQKNLTSRVDELCSLEKEKSTTIQDQIKGSYAELKDTIKEQERLVKASIEGLERNSIQVRIVEEEILFIKQNEKRLSMAVQPVMVSQIQPAFEKINNLSLKYKNNDQAVESNPGAEITEAFFGKKPLSKAGKYYFSLQIGKLVRGANSYVVVGVAVPSFKESQMVLDNNCYFINPFDKTVYLNSEDKSYESDKLKPEDIIHVIIDRDENTIQFKINEMIVTGGAINAAGLTQTDLYPCVYFEQCKDLKVSFL